MPRTPQPNTTGLAPTLTPEAYAHCFQTYQSMSGERAVMLRWIQDTLALALARRRQQRQRLTILSVGCGTGDFDTAAIKTLSRSYALVDYIGLDPNVRHRCAFTARLSRHPLPGVQLALHNMSFERYATRRKFDVVFLTHCLYYIPDRERAIRKALSLLRQDGRVVIFNQTRLGIDQIQRRFLKQVKGRDDEKLSSHDLQNILKRRGLAWHLNILDNVVDITACFTPRNRTGQDLISFFLESDTRRLPPIIQRKIKTFLKTLCLRRNKRQLMVHPMAVFMLGKGKSSKLT